MQTQEPAGGSCSTMKGHLTPVVILPHVTLLSVEPVQVTFAARLLPPSLLPPWSLVSQSFARPVFCPPVF